MTCICQCKDALSGTETTFAVVLSSQSCTWLARSVSHQQTVESKQRKCVWHYISLHKITLDKIKFYRQKRCFLHASHTLEGRSCALNHEGVGLNISAVTLYIWEDRGWWMAVKEQRSADDPRKGAHNCQHHDLQQDSSNIKGKSYVDDWGQGLLPPPMIVTMVMIFHNMFVTLHPSEAEVLQASLCGLNQLFPQHNNHWAF